jgi:uncharacterized DUF497 family protein
MPLIILDEPKRLFNLDKHGLDFRLLTQDFLEVAEIQPARDGRTKARGSVKGVGLVIVVYRRLGSEAVSIISLRKAGAKDRRSPEWQGKSS